MLEFQLRKAKKSIGALQGELQELAEELAVEFGGDGSASS
jgi:hypothetical protein